MTLSDNQSAKAVLADGWDIYTRLDQLREPGETQADLIALWKTVEQTLQTLIGGSTLLGQTLIAEVRQRGSVGFEQANALVAFWDLRVRLDSPSHTPALTDVVTARTAYEQLRFALDSVHVAKPDATRVVGRGGSGVTSGAYGDSGASGGSGASGTSDLSVRQNLVGGFDSRVSDSPTPAPAKKNSSAKILGTGCTVTVVAFLVIIGLFFWMLNIGSSYEKKRNAAVIQMQDGQTQLAYSSFMALERENPTKAEPKVFIGRLLRGEGRIDEARERLIEAIELEPGNAIALRELALLFYSQDDFVQSRTFFTHAIKANPDDKMSLGYMGCTLVNLKQPDLAVRFFDRAGPGQWDSCK